MNDPTRRWARYADLEALPGSVPHSRNRGSSHCALASIGLFAAFATGCPRSIQPVDSTIDAAVLADVADDDAGPTYCYEGGLAPDASTDNVSTRDAAACPAAVVEHDPNSAESCDGPGMTRCRDWAIDNAGPNAGPAFASCFPLHQYVPCLRASYCDYRSDAGNCHCGREPPCPTGFVCAADTPCGVPYCRCATPF